MKKSVKMKKSKKKEKVQRNEKPEIFSKKISKKTEKSQKKLKNQISFSQGERERNQRKGRDFRTSKTGGAQVRPGNGRSGTEYPWILVPQLRGLPGRTGTESTERNPLRFPTSRNGRHRPPNNLVNGLSALQVTPII